MQRKTHRSSLSLGFGSETTWPARSPFEILCVITNGTLQRKFLWVARRRSGIYVASGDPNHLHTSYHQDGRLHWKSAKHKVLVPLGQREPLAALTRPALVQNATVVISDRVLGRFDLANFKDEPVDQVIYLDNRLLPEAISYEVWAIPRIGDSEVFGYPEWPSQAHVVFHTDPWLLFIVQEQGSRRTAHRHGAA
jgi:hypothetical protein